MASGHALFEREAELRSLGELVSASGAGLPGVVVIEGPSGIGKTQLLNAALDNASGAGLRILRARCGQMEEQFPFGVVRQLFEQSVIQDPDLLTGAAAGTAEWVLDASASDESAPPGDTSFAGLHSLYWLTANIADSGPLILAVDDLHWCDEPSMRFLAFLSRRLDGLPVTIVGATRPPDDGARSVLLGEITGSPLARLLAPRSLSVEATELMVSGRLEGEVDRRFSTTCHTATGGNPLLLGELLSGLASEGVTPDADHIDQVAELGPGAISRTVEMKLALLPENATTVARATAVLGEQADLSLLTELVGVDKISVAAAAGDLAKYEIFDTKSQTAFLHPLVGAAIYTGIPPHDRALLHEHAARVLHERSMDATVIATHLALSPAHSEGWTCDVLERAAGIAIRAGSPASAITWLRRALAESPPHERRLRLLLDLGQVEASLDGEAATEHLSEVIAQSGDLRMRMEATLTLARTWMFTGRSEEGLELLHRSIDELGPEADDLRRAFKAAALTAPLFGVGDESPEPPPAADRTLPPGSGPGAKMLAAMTARRWAYAGGPADLCGDLALAAIEDGELIAADNLHFSLTAAFVLDLADRAEAVSIRERLGRDASLRGSLASRGASNLYGSLGLVRRGELAEAETALREAFDDLRLISADVGVHHAAFLSLTQLERGNVTDARRTFDAVTDPGDTSDAARYWLDSNTRLLIAERRFPEAIECAEESERRFAALLNPIDTPARSHRALAFFHLGRRDESHALASDELEMARRWGTPGSVGRVLRLLGIIESEDGLERLEGSVAATAGTTARLEHAKSLAALGQALRIARRPTEARESLRLALDLADQIGADTLFAYTRTELLAAGGRPRTTALTGPDSLTPAEGRVAERAADGQTNREIAGALFVTEKTVERHLSNTYRKLGIAARQELADSLATRR